MLNSFDKAPYLSAETDLGGGDGFDSFDDVSVSDTDTIEPVDETVTEDTKPTETVDEKPSEITETKVKLKYNHEEKEYSLDEVKTLAQKGMNYEKALERNKQESIDNYIASQGYEWNGKPIKTEAEYNNALYEQSLVEKGVDPETVRKGVDEHPDVVKAREIARQKEQQEANSSMYDRFARQFPDVKAEMIKPETWAKVSEGIDITTAYIEQRNKDLETELNTLKQNASNGLKAPISGVSVHGTNPTQDKDFVGWEDD